MTNLLGREGELSDATFEAVDLDHLVDHLSHALQVVGRTCGHFTELNLMMVIESFVYSFE
jgi:hypothetical protein